MPDREKVVKGLEELEGFIFKEYTNIKAEESKIYYDCFKSLSDAIDLLKEQEAKAVEWRLGRAHCPSCGELFPKKQEKQYIRFCNWCGQAVKWE